MVKVTSKLRSKKKYRASLNLLCLFVPDSLLMILGCSKFSLTLPSSLQQALMFGMVVAKPVILRDWKSASPPCFKKWLNDMISCIYLEEIRFTLSDAHHKFLEWSSG